MVRIEHFWEELPGPVWFNGQAIYRAQVERASDGAVFVELGAWKGRSTAFMGVEIANSGKNIDFYTVDTWEGSEGELPHQQDPDVIAGKLFDTFMTNIAPVREYVNELQCLSTDAAAHFGDGTVDFVYVDAGHTEEDVLADLEAWWPKLKRGGIIAGDDWEFQDVCKNNEFSVRRAVKSFFGRNESLGAISLREGYCHPHWTQWEVRKELL